jgi:uncharacterized protein (DUF2141 family)
VKQILLIISFLTYTVATNAQGKVIASVSQLASNKGVCRACIFANASAFQKMTALQCLTVPIVNQKALFTFTGIPKGKYALFVFHDVNENNKLDRIGWEYQKKDTGLPSTNCLLLLHLLMNLIVLS